MTRRIRLSWDTLPAVEMCLCTQRLLGKKMEYTNLKLKFVEGEVTGEKLEEQRRKTTECLGSQGASGPPPDLDLPAVEATSPAVPGGKVSSEKAGETRWKKVFFSGRKKRPCATQLANSGFKDGFGGVLQLFRRKKNSTKSGKDDNPDKWSLSHSDIELGDLHGRGHFGDVFKAFYKPEKIDVAVKTFRETVDVRLREKLLMRARILKGYNHVNIVRYIGVCTDQQPVYIVLEFVPGGDLIKYLKEKQYSLMTKQLVKMCEDACSGLDYLEAQKWVHGDVAARNCHVASDGLVKITDFGMSREEEDGIFDVSGVMKQIPIKWTAPEALNYGERMKNPSGCPQRMYNVVMLRCWEAEDVRRPHFSDLLKTIKSIRA